MSDETTFPKGDLMRGKKGLVMGVANHNSIAYGIASQLAAQGAEMAWTYMGEALERRVRPLAEGIGVKHLIACDVTDDASMDSAFAEIAAKLGELDGAEVRHLDGYRFAVVGTKDGRTVRIEQDMIVNISVKGTLFNQFPSRIYVDGKFTSAANYAKL